MPSSRRRIDVDVVDAHAGSSDNLQLRAGGNHVRGYPGLAAHDQAIVTADDLEELVAAQPEAYVYFGVFLERVNPVLRDGIDDEDRQAAPS